MRNSELSTKEANTPVVKGSATLSKCASLRSLIWVKVRLLFVMLLLVSSSITADATEEVTFVGDDNYPPYSYLEEGLAKGVYVDILKAVFERLPDYRVSFSMMPWKRGMAYIKQGTRLAIFPPYYWPKKRPYIEFYSVPLLLEEIVVICDNSVLTPKRKKWPNDYYGLRVATNRGFLSPGPDFFEAVKRKDISLTETMSTEHGLRMILLKRVDCYVNSKLAIQWALKQLKIDQSEESISSVFSIAAVVKRQWGYLAYSTMVQKDSCRDMRLQVDETLRLMRKEGVIEKVTEDFFRD